jgi:hypothetical protein
MLPGRGPTLSPFFYGYHDQVEIVRIKFLSEEGNDNDNRLDKSD